MFSSTLEAEAKNDCLFKKKKYFNSPEQLLFARRLKVVKLAFDYLNIEYGQFCPSDEVQVFSLLDIHIPTCKNRSHTFELVFILSSRRIPKINIRALG